MCIRDRATAANPPQSEYAAAKSARPIILVNNILPSPLPMIVSRAFPPKNKTVVKFTKTNKAIQKTASIVFRFELYLFSINSGIVYNPFR